MCNYFASQIMLFDAEFLEPYICGNSGHAAIIECDTTEAVAQVRCEEELSLLKQRYCNLNQSSREEVHRIWLSQVRTKRVADFVS